MDAETRGTRERNLMNDMNMDGMMMMCMIVGDGGRRDEANQNIVSP